MTLGDRCFSQSNCQGYQRCRTGSYAMIGADAVEHVSMTAKSTSAQGSRVISRMLPVAVKLWLQTQLDEIGELTFEIQATDRQVLSGHIPGIALWAQQAVYRGIRLTDVNVTARDIKINIGQVLRGKPLRLKQSFPIEGQVAWNAKDLKASSTASILADGLMDVWQALLANDKVAAEIVGHYGNSVGPDLAQYRGAMEVVDTELLLSLVRDGQSDIGLRGWLEIEEGRSLRLGTPRWRLPSGSYVDSAALRDFCWDLGDQTDLRSLTVQNEQLTCQCRIMVQP